MPRKLPSCEETGTNFIKPTFEREGFEAVAEAAGDAVFKEAPLAAAMRALHPPPNALAAITDDHYLSLSHYSLTFSLSLPLSEFNFDFSLGELCTESKGFYELRSPILGLFFGAQTI